MRIRFVRTALAGAAVVLAAAGTTAAAAPAAETGVARTASASRAAAPAFLAPGELPRHRSSPWYASKVTPGLPDPEPFCLEGALPGGAGTYHRSFHTEFDTGATQVSVVAADEAGARELAAELRDAVAGCAADWLRDTPGATAAWDDYGTVTAGDEVRVYGVHTSIPDSEPGVNLFGVGRSGHTVTVVRWAEMGDLGQAPVPAFKATMKAAVNKLA